ncbi:amidohydrolase family protein [Microbacterium sp. JZ31]|uniref:amidohydrolase family protein n=1 Tax=Microbacterium sp. JZ31 TaxID=1906274 RepID=UPI0019341574|nr:amidohydrolase family protein [Microbacterium sp. JZ31]
MSDADTAQDGPAGLLDAHVHVWRPSALPYPWLRSVPTLARDFAPADLDDAGGAIREWVFVEADADLDAALDEVAWVSSLDWPGLRAIVAHADLTSPQLAEHLATLSRFPLVRGVRHSLQDAPPDVLASRAFARGLRTVGEAGLTFDACVRSPQLEALAEATAQAPGTPIVLDHLGKPPVGPGPDSGEGRRWHRAVVRLSAQRNVSVKLSGLAAEAPSAPALAAHGPAFLRAALELFGPSRAMFGGDWPVSGMPGAGVPVETALAMLREVVPAHDRHDVFGGTARRFYRIANV